jgi:hypothetical protein
MTGDLVYCSFVDGLCKRRFFDDCAVLKRASSKFEFDRGVVFPYDCPRACEVWLSRKGVVQLESCKV